MSLKYSERAPVVWCIGGSDSCAGAGIQADLKAVTLLGGHACTIVTAITAQNSHQVCHIEVPKMECLKAQLQVLQSDFSPQVIKIGMLGTLENVREVIAYLEAFPVPVVYDPVLKSSSGFSLMDSSALTLMKDQLLPKVQVMTPNLLETEELVGFKVDDPAQIENAARKLINFGIKSVVIKGGHAVGNLSQDYWTEGQKSAWLNLRRQDSKSARGTGCTFASALATALAFGFDSLDSAIIAKAFVSQGLRGSQPLGSGSAILKNKPWPPSSEDMPWLTPTSELGNKKYHFLRCGAEPLGLYPVVDRFAWLERLLPLGVTTIQLRIKDLQGEDLQNEIRRSVSLARKYECRLFINDYWEIALQEGAYGVHLGQEDLETTDLDRLEKAEIRLGISTHCYSEVARAHAIGPSYIAVGPIFPTILKVMRFAPQGVENFKMWRQMLDCPLVAIGGVTLDKARELIANGANGLAVVSDITKNRDPEGRTKSWLEEIQNSKFISFSV